MPEESMEDNSEVSRAQGPGSVRRRLTLNFSALLLSPVVTLAVQIVNVPVFLHVWGAERYGEWLLLSAVPTYLAISDMGFGTVAGNDMTMRVARGDTAGALRTFQSTWKLISIVSLTLAAVLLPLLLLVPVTRLLRLKDIAPADARLILVVLVIDALACLQTSLPGSAFMSAGLNHVGALGVSLIRACEGACGVAVVLSGHGPVLLACTLLTVRAVGNVSMAILARRRVPWLRFGFGHASRQTLRELLRPAMAYMAFPVANAASIQGTLLAIGAVLGPVYVAMYTPLRTAARAAQQATTILKYSFWPEISAAFGAQRFELARRLHRVACQLALLASGSVLVLLCVIGPWVLRLWTHGGIRIDLPTFYLLLATAAVNIFWDTSSVVPIAANRHARMALQQMLSTLAALGCAVLLMHVIGLPGCALGMLLAEFYMMLVVVPASVGLLHDPLPSFLRSLFDLRALAQTLKRGIGQNALKQAGG